MKKKWLTVLSLVLLVVLCVSFVGKNTVFACRGDNCAVSGNTDGGGGGYQSGCEHNYNTCTGAAWKYYSWPEGATSVHIDGETSANSIYKAADITGEAAAICAEAQGYFRYAMVHKTTGQQWGTMSLAGNSSDTFNTNMIEGGRMHYSGPEDGLGGLDWNDVVNAYNKAVEKYGQFGDGFVRGSNMSWFCASYGDDPPGETSSDSYCPGINAPDGYTSSNNNEGWSSVVTKVRMASIQGAWVDDLFAKPGDVVEWRHCYFPGAQKVATKKVTTKHNKPTTINSEDTVFPNTNIYMYQYDEWNNGFNITDRSGSSARHDYGTSDETRADVRHYDSYSYNVGQNWVGGSSQESSSLGVANSGETYHVWAHAWNSGASNENHTWDCTYTHDETFNDTNSAREHDGCWQETGDYTCIGGKDLYNCSFASNPKEKCACNGGKWGRGKSVVVPCTVSVTEKLRCSHGTGDNGIDYLNYGRDDTPKAGDKTYDYATVSVPYNYNITGSATLNDGVVYAGETATIKSGEIKLINRYNATTKGSYITKAKGVKAWFVTYVSTTSDGNNPVGGQKRVEENPSFDGDIEADNPVVSFNGEVVNVDDTTAGNYFCVALKYTPTTSGAQDYDGDTNMSGVGIGEAISEASCRQIAKRPTVQVWGGSLFSNGNITTSRAKKNNLNGFSDRRYKISGVNDANVFGSWDELSVMTIGLNQKFGSGAGTADRQLGGWTGVGRYEKKEVDAGFCKYESPLTFANYAKKGKQICGVTKNATGQFSKAGIIVEKESYVTSITNGKKPSGGSVGNAPFQLGVGGTYSVVTSATGKQFLYTIGNGDIHITTSEIALGQTYIVQSTGGSVFIEGDITYKDGAANADEIPKLIVYAKNDIKINCSVNRVDAALIAENTVDTCRDSNNINDAKRSNQLVINGTVIANKINLKRTYGAGAGIYSSIPAEIINYDSSLVMWARSRADTTQTGTLNETYTHELAPRY